MFVETQTWEKDEDYRRLIKNFEPPPPPGNENAWELQFCKWWGWNWIKKKEGPNQNVGPNEALMQRAIALRPVEAKKPEKKPIKNLCQSLCFKKKKEQKPLQEKFNTPSASTTEMKDQKNQYNKKASFASAKNRTDSIVEKEIEEQIKKETREQLYAPATQNKKTFIRKDSSTSFTDGDTPCKDNDRSSTEESVDYINIKCCSCCHPRHSCPAKKRTDEKFTQDTFPQSKMMATQTEKKEKKEKKERKRSRKRICVVCCCKCQQNYQRSCCPCCSWDNIGQTDENEEKKRKSIEPDIHKSGAPVESQNPVMAYTASIRQPFRQKDSKKSTSKQPAHLRKKFEPIYATGMPIDTMLYRNKPMTKFGVPSQKYSWIHATKSDIWDQWSHSRIHEFSSPLSGKTYSISPIKFDDLESEPSTLLDPISVDEELENLKKIESGVRMDLKSRVMLDAVCDAILAKDQETDASSSILLNEFTYPTNVTQTECVMKDLYKTERKVTCSRLNQTEYLEKRLFEDTTNKNLVNSETNTSNVSQGSLGSRKNSSLRDYLNTNIPETYSITNSYRRVYNPYLSLNYNVGHEHLPSNQNKCSHKLLNYAGTNNQSLIPRRRQPTFERPKLIPTSKRSASPTLRGQDIKKVKLGESSALANLNNTNVSDIFKKIDEIILRSKVNNEEIQSVLNNIPKRTYKFFTSWEVSNLINQNSSVENVDEEESVNSCAHATSEDKKEKNDKTKILQTKKKKVCNKPSMIPKRVTDSRLHKRNVGS